MRLLGKEREIIGKWMVFKRFDTLDDTWEIIRTAMIQDELQDCIFAGVSTMRYNPSMGGPGSDTTGVICVYTEEHNMDAIGFKFSELVKKDIKYKTERATCNREYSFTGPGRVSIKTIYWNNGRPSFECEDRPCYGTSYRREDIWHLNVVEAPKTLNLGAVHGRWVLFLEYEDLTRLWHFLKKQIESEKSNFGVIRMVCPSKRVRNSPTEKPEFHLYTNEESKRLVGLQMIRIVKSDIVYQHKPRQSGPQVKEEILFWNDGEPAYERVRRKGITKNWRTGEDIDM